MNLSRKQLPVFEFSPKGYKKLKKELKELEKKRPKAVEDLAEARSMGDLSENGYYKEARANLSSLDSRIRRIKLMLKYGKVINKKLGREISFGSKVEVRIKRAKKSFEIVGKEESNPSKGKLSKDSPIGRALMGRQKGDKVKVKIPGGEMECEVIEIS